MNRLSDNKLIDAVGAFTALAGAAVVAAIVVPADPLGRAIGALLGASLLLGVVAALVREALKRGQEPHLPALREPRIVTAATLMPMLRLADATASEFDGEPRPAFAPIVSLTEVQVERQRAAQRREQRPMLTKA
jgi:hypothetical protein